MIRELLPRLVRGERLAREETAAAIRSMMQGGEDPALVGAFLMALAQRGETADELAGAAEALRAEAVPFPGEGPLLDTCGTGGDGTHTYNISTVVGFIAAAAGRRVAKHGNRSVSSRCGSADVLEALGARVDLGPEGAMRALGETGFCFLYAPRFHPSMKEVAGVRRSLGVRTLFNWAGPLANPARATHQLLGVSDRARVDVVARVLDSLGVERALVVHGAGGLDELALERGNYAVWVERGRLPQAVTVEAAEIDLPEAPVQALEGGTPEENAAHVRGVLAGEAGARRDAAILNAAAALWIAGAAGSLREGAALAREALDSGEAARVLERYVALSREMGAD